MGPGQPSLVGGKLVLQWFLCDSLRCFPVGHGPVMQLVVMKVLVAGT
jgi:hypothetical protein